MTRHTGNRYGRSESARRAVLHAADDLVAAHGYGGVTVEGIARAAGVSKQTIYRWWGSKADVLLDVLVDFADTALVPEDAGALEAELAAHVRGVAAFLFETDEGAVFRGLLGEAQHDFATAESLRSVFLEPQRERDRSPFVRAVARGQAPAALDIDGAVDRLVGPLYYRALLGAPAPDEEFLDALVRAAVGVARCEPT